MYSSVGKRIELYYQTGLALENFNFGLVKQNKIKLTFTYVISSESTFAWIGDFNSTCMYIRHSVVFGLYLTALHVVPQFARQLRMVGDVTCLTLIPFSNTDLINSDDVWSAKVVDQ